jgi:hypothetical protein
MEIVTFKKSEFFNLEKEFVGVVDTKENKVLIKGLLNENFKLVTKVKLSNLLDKIRETTLDIEEKKNELIIKYGEAQPDGTTFIPIFINITTDEKGDLVSRDENPNYKEFQKEFQQVLLQEKELEFEPLTNQDLGEVSSYDNYPTFYKLVKLG